MFLIFLRKNFFSCGNHTQNGNVAQRGTTRAQRFERLVTRRVDDEQTRDFEQMLVNVATHLGALLYGLERHIRSAYLLRDAARFVFLDARATQIVQYLCFARVYVAEYADDRRAQVVHAAVLLGFIVSFLRFYF